MMPLSVPSRENKIRQSLRQVSEFMSLNFDGVEPPAQLGLTCRMLVFLRSLSDKVLYWEGQERYGEHKFELLNLTDLQMVAIGETIERSRVLIDQKNYRHAFEELCAAKQHFHQQEHSKMCGDDQASVVYEIPPVPRSGLVFENPLAVFPVHRRLLGPTPLHPTKNSFIHYADAGVPPSPIDLMRSSTVPAEVSRTWDEDTADISTCDGDVASDLEASDVENFLPTYLPAEVPGIDQQHWNEEQGNREATVTVGTPFWASDCTAEANHAMGVASAWAQQFCMPGFSVQMLGIVPVDADCQNWHTRNPMLFMTEDVAEPAPQVTSSQHKHSGSKGDACHVIEHMASSLRTLDTSIVKKANLAVGNFTITIFPKRATLKKNGSSFRASKGQCTVQVKCNSDIKREFELALGLGNALPAVTVQHDFSRHPVCNIPGVVDLKNAVDEKGSLFRLTVEFTVV
jgi:hypothetical protein